jgi:hypothetical protein
VINTQGLREELISKNEEMWLGLQAVTTSLDMRTKNLREELSAKIEETQLGLQTSLDTRTKNLCEELDGEILDNRIHMKATKSKPELSLNVATAQEPT